MAALVAGVQYGLSSHSNFHENKSLIFVKLTDSAQRAIEDYLRNRNKTSQNPTIQFLGNEGQLSFPSTQSSHGSAGFTFSLSGNQDIEGPQGGFECIQQTGPETLESLGALPCKMRIQANDDVYETTRHRMAVAEENNKNKCTRVIKPNGPDIGRKVKVKGTGRTIPPPANPSSRHKELASIPSSGSQARLSSSTYKPAPSNKSPPVARAPPPEKKVSDIMRRPLKERLIHLLALRPYKKPELYDRINREGVRERERSAMTTILKQVAFMRDNTYHLHRYVWNDVQEEWPYYSEQEKAMLKRRKPQNLTPPGSSDGGSSGSGQSPNSTHPGSPPGVTAPPPALLNSKRPGYYQGTDGLPTKRPRISHYRKPEANNEIGRTAGGGGSGGGVIVVSGTGSGLTGSNNNNNNNSSSNGSGSASGNVGGSTDSWDHRQQKRADYRAERTSNSEVLRANNYSKPCLTPTSDSEEPTQPRESSSSILGSTNPGSHNSHSSLAHNSLQQLSNRHHQNAKSSDSSVDYTRNAQSSAASGDYSASSNGTADRRDRNERNGRAERARESRERSLPSGSTSSTGISSRVPSANCVNNPDNTVTTTSCDMELPESPNHTEYPDYLTYFTTISSTEQRKRYKTEFNADYDEYRRLHTEVSEVSQRFTDLQARLKQEEAAENWVEYEAIKQLILAEYIKTKNDPLHQKNKSRFQFLHAKLGHIKRLVVDYDAKHNIGMAINSNN
ncbi:RNA polymerase II elongation factor Ell [Prorops nasuta]|uniref:RNA polymerase II elongation factor Ell n=1 Tax=Prorops nasuta TaxID=863751 RepID=UPI0034CE9591